VPTTIPTPTITPVPSSGIQWGAYVGESVSDLAYFEGKIGKPVNIQAVFVGWGQYGVFPSQYKATVGDKGKILLVFWEPSVDCSSIVSGAYDSYMAKFASDASSYSGKVILAPLHEMNGDWSIWDGQHNTAVQVVNAWKYMRRFFTSDNVKFGWDVNNVSVPNVASNQIGNYYPGGDYVDYVGVDGFNFGYPWQTWDQVFPSALMSQLRSYGKPVYIFSTASMQGTQKAQWIYDLGAGAQKYGLSGWVWFNINKERNWLVWSDSNSLAAFRSIVE
jgi:hypothetical protein